MPKQDRWPGNAEQEHIACIASIHPPARGPSAKQTPFPPPRPPRRTPPGQPGKQGTQVEASSACARRAAAPKTSAQICAVLTKRSCASCGRAMARVTLTSLGPCVPMRRRYKLKLPLRHMGLQGSLVSNPFIQSGRGGSCSPAHFVALICQTEVQSMHSTCGKRPSAKRALRRCGIVAQHAREAPEIRGSEDPSSPRLKAFSTFGQSIQRMRSRDCLSPNKLPGQRRAP